MVPDLGVLFPRFVSYPLTHSIPGIVWACPLLGLVCYAVYVTIMREPLAALLPRWIQHRLPEPSGPFRLHDCPKVLVAAGIGASTHVFWDSFTHLNRWGTRLVPVLNSTAFELRGLPVPWCRVLQYGFTFVLMPAMAFELWRWLKKREPTSRPFSVPKPWKIVAGVICLAVPFAVCAWHATDTRPSSVVFGQIVKQTLVSYVFLSVAVSVLITARFGTASGSLSENEP